MMLQHIQRLKGTDKKIILLSREENEGEVEHRNCYGTMRYLIWLNGKIVSDYRTAHATAKKLAALCTKFNLEIL